MDNKETTANKKEIPASKENGISREDGKLPVTTDNLASLPPKRGAIKQQIFSSIKSVFKGNSSDSLSKLNR
jgi:hypothetical protein